MKNATTNSKSNAPLKFAFVGAGMLFRNGYSGWLGDFLKSNRHKYVLTAICDPDAKAGSKYAKMFAAKHYADYIEMLEDAAPRAVVINTPHWLHEEQTIQSARRGAAVLCEKPMAPSAASCRRMISECDKAAVSLQVGFMRRFIPGFQTIRKLARGGELGKILDIEVDWPYYIPDISQSPFKEISHGVEAATGINLPQTFGAWRLKDKRSGGGIFLDHAPHILDLFRFWNGEIDKILAITHSSIPDENDDFAKAVARFENGAIGSIVTSLRDLKSPLLGEIKGFIRGDSGRVDFTLPNPTHFAPMKKIDFYKQPSAPLDRIVFLSGARKKEIHFTAYNTFRDQLEYFLSNTQGARKHNPFFGREDFAANGRDGLIATQLVEAAYKSANQESNWIRVGKKTDARRAAVPANKKATIKKLSIISDT